ncbi:hypothetical protein [Mycobacterium conspicuum]|uniref:Uncharacterized protein n=1 Tax=Mycobacterium conspicuum TaxID=44010 RepID=A0A1X1SYL1_9MYCO|nr:hypothetical protein [Mycobacterium conspicuum]ORV36684.1 hypothetical protein AWC00_24120 [Mycobacterium conspicuum]BBZ42711.1 hypothetical protein MCNS_57740 [Mycobacterium conspicuum]
MLGAGHRAFVSELARFAAEGIDERLAAVAERAAAPVRVAVRGRRGVGRSAVARALNIGDIGAAREPDVLVYVLAEVVKPEDARAVAAARCPVLAVLNKADVTGFAGDGPMALARARCTHFSELLGVRVLPMSGLLAVAAQLEDPGSGALGPFGAAVAVAAARRGIPPAQVRALLRRVSGVDAVLDRLDGVSADVRYRRVLDAVAELEALAVANPDIGGFLARDDTVLARMAAAVDVAESAGLDVEECRDRAGYLARAARWQRYGRAQARVVHRACGADIARGSLRLWAGAPA